MKKIGFVTSEEDPGLVEDDKLAIAPLRAAGIDVVPVVWDRAENLSRLDALVFRSCWNYHRKHDAFVEWIGAVRRLGIPSCNPLDVVEWNLDKKYLLELAAKGVAIPVTQWIPRLGPQPGAPLLGGKFDRVVVKPSVSLNGEDTFLVAPDDAKVPEILGSILPRAGVIVQEYLPEIESAGEVSFVFFRGEFSHAIRKLPKAGEFRVQAEHGGRRVPVTPSADLVKQAQSVLECSRPLLYARVDTVERRGKLILMELEIVDPLLFLGYAEGAAERFARAIEEELRALG